MRTIRAFIRSAGFDQPILHGLSTSGLVTRALVIDSGQASVDSFAGPNAGQG
ncbi:acyl dehydratase [Sphingobium fontiphilum]|uniref:Acyl dehydratase n=1 Tax=Sphingobium fontiphilum TaxID=944425 RepID=A0A7W6GPN9_9SPHN|nr:MaoC/PaaZ C-terminal domain-containing protein [Sphingobium fontiphilum]MBB3982742.1 acyl dehydratase [Sphingobium fontiphilum]